MQGQSAQYDELIIKSFKALKSRASCFIEDFVIQCKISNGTAMCSITHLLLKLLFCMSLSSTFTSL